jgi:predicted ATPase
MKLDVSVKNLGQIKEATFNIRPMTVITGPNGTGKSFFTKSLYSIFNVINKNVYHESVNQTIRQIQLQLDSLLNSAEYVPASDVGAIHVTKHRLDTLQMEFEDASGWKIDDYLVFVASKAVVVENIYNSLAMYSRDLMGLSKNVRIPREEIDSMSEDEINSIRSIFDSIPSISEAISKNFENFRLQLKNPQKYYFEFFSTHIENELKDNFQISALDELISFGEEKIEIKVEGLLVIEFRGNKKIAFEMESDFIDDVAKLASVVFFESPAYWKVRDALKWSKNNPYRSFFGKKKGDVLTGVPKYFYDLDDALTIKTKTEGVFKSATDILEKELGGEFIFKGDNLSFKDKNGREISKHLVSFGMTNLGMIQALLKHNVITEGSFIFIDEPETNLHPDWQVKLAEVLLVLAQGGVNIVITTHSSDFVKALEVKIKKLHIEVMEDFLSVHFVDVDGKLLEFESTDKIQQLIEARELISLAYQELYFSDL